MPTPPVGGSESRKVGQGGFSRRTFVALCSALGLSEPGKLDDVMASIDLFITPSFASGLLQMTNLSGHPALVLPNGFNPDGTPVSLSFIGRLYGDAELLAVGEAYQAATDFHRKHPAKFS